MGGGGGGGGSGRIIYVHFFPLSKFDKNNFFVFPYILFINTWRTVSRPVQTDATSHNIVGPNNVGSCWHLLRGACKRTQQLPLTLLT